MKRNRPMLFIITWALIGIIYSPVFIAAWLLHVIARLLLAISYYGLLNAKTGHDVLTSILKWNPRL